MAFEGIKHESNRFEGVGESLEGCLRALEGL